MTALRDHQLTTGPIEFPIIDVAYGRYFEPARQAAETWHAHRTAFMTAKLNQGRHPDTDPGFWQGYEELAGIDLPDKTLWEKLLDWLKQNFFVLFLLMVFGFPAWRSVSWIWRRRKP